MGGILGGNHAGGFIRARQGRGWLCV